MEVAGALGRVESLDLVVTGTAAGCVRAGGGVTHGGKRRGPSGDVRWRVGPDEGAGGGMRRVPMLGGGGHDPVRRECLCAPSQGFRGRSASFTEGSFFSGDGHTLVGRGVRIKEED